MAAISPKYQAFRSLFDRLVNSVKPVVGEVAKKAFSENLISRENLSHAENLLLGEGQRSSMLLSRILDKIEERETHYNIFVNILHSIPVLIDVAGDLELRRSIGLESKATSPDNPILRYSMYLKGVYKSAAITSSDKFPHLTCSKFINLALIKKERVSQSEADEFTKATLHGHVDEILKKKEPIKLEEVLNPTEGQPSIKCVILEGAPGIGKSTCVGELCKRWDEIDSLKMYSLVILIRLREKLVQEAQNIEDLLYHRNKDLRQDVAAEVEACEGRGVLFIFDGFDELPTSLRKKSIFTELIQSKYLSQCRVLVTSRPSATADLQIVAQSQMHKQVEVVGFNQENIEEYAATVFATQPDVLANFLTYILIFPAIRSMMYVPLNCTIVAEIYRHSKTANRPIPQTMTQLYIEMSMTLLARHLGGDNPLVDQLPEKLEDLPSQLYQPFSVLARLAFEGLEKDKFIFYELPEGCDGFGFLTSPTELYIGRKTFVCHNFLHLSLQEFLAAFHVSQLSPNDQKGVFQRYEYRWYVVWRFLAGLTGFSGIGWEMVRSMTDPGRRQWWGTSTERKIVTPFIVQCLYEAQRKVQCDLVLTETEVRFDARLGTALDCYAAGYCVGNSSRKWKLYVYRPMVAGSTVVNMLKFGLESCSEGTSRKGNTNILSLTLRNCGINAVSFNQLADFIPLMINLERLEISENPAGEGGLVKLLHSLTLLKSLQSLSMYKNKIGCSDIEALSHLITPTSSVKELWIGDLDTSTEVAELTFKTVLSLSSLKKLVLLDRNWTDNAITLLEQNENLTEIRQFVNASNHVSSTASISQALHKNSNLKSLQFEYEYGIWGTHIQVIIPHLIKLLECNNSLESLLLYTSNSSDAFTVRQVLSLNSAIQNNHTLKKLSVTVPDEQGFKRYAKHHAHIQLDTRLYLIDNPF